jgi:hypothetical protein
MTFDLSYSPIYLIERAKLNAEPAQKARNERFLGKLNRATRVA